MLKCVTDNLNVDADISKYFNNIAECAGGTEEYTDSICFNSPRNVYLTIQDVASCVGLITPLPFDTDACTRSGIRWVANCARNVINVDIGETFSENNVRSFVECVGEDIVTGSYDYIRRSANSAINALNGDNTAINLELQDILGVQDVCDNSNTTATPSKAAVNTPTYVRTPTSGPVTGPPTLRQRKETLAPDVDGIVDGDGAEPIEEATGTAGIAQQPIEEPDATPPTTDQLTPVGSGSYKLTNLSLNALTIAMLAIALNELNRV
jgi:hypothetical protein